jgi:ABC-type transporter MlaC component
MNLRGFAISLALAMPASSHAFDNKQFCQAVQQVVIAAEKDIGIWLDRVTRNAGMRTVCDQKLVEFMRFTYAASASMTADWRTAKSAEWNAGHCSSSLWREAIDNGWKIVLHISSADGGQTTLTAQCR